MPSETNVILNYRRDSDRWLCPDCDSENMLSSYYCSICGCQKPAKPVILNTYSEVANTPSSVYADYTPPVDKYVPVDITKNQSNAWKWFLAIALIVLAIAIINSL